MTDAVAQHAALLAKLAEYDNDPPRCAGDPPWFCGSEEYMVAVRALRTVVELHTPFERGYIGMYCAACSVPVDEGGPRYHFLADWPCSTIRAVAGALGVDLNGCG